MIKLSNVKLLIVVVGVVLLGLGLVVLLTRGPAPPEPLPQLPKVEISPVVPQPVGVSQYSLRASLPDIEKMAVYEYMWADTRVRPYESWAKVLGFAGEPEEIEDALEGTLYLWSKPGQTLVIDQQASGLSYRVDLNEPAILSGSFLPSFEQAAAIVERTLVELWPARGGLDLLKYDSTKNKALRTGVSLVQETTLTEAELLEIHFTAKVDDHLIYLESGPEWDPVLAWIGRDGKLLRLEYHPVGSLGEKIADYLLKNEEEVLKDLDNGKGVVVSSSLEGGEEIVSTTITKVDLGYPLPQPDATVIQPIFVLSGQARTAKGKTGQIVIYLEAVR